MWKRIYLRSVKPGRNLNREAGRNLSPLRSRPARNWIAPRMAIEKSVELREPTEPQAISHRFPVHEEPWVVGVRASRHSCLDCSQGTWRSRLILLNGVDHNRCSNCRDTRGNSLLFSCSYLLVANSPRRPSQMTSLIVFRCRAAKHFSPVLPPPFIIHSLQSDGDATNRVEREESMRIAC